MDARAELSLYFVVSYCSLSPCNASNARDIISSARENMPSTRDIKLLATDNPQRTRNIKKFLDYLRVPGLAQLDG